MAPPLVVANAVQIRLDYTQVDEIAQNVLNFQAAGSVAVNQGLADQVGTAIKNAFTSQWAAHAPTNLSLDRVGVRDLRTPNGLEYFDTGAVVRGTLPVGNELPKASAIVITLRTAKAGKSYRGRVYVPGIGAEPVGGNDTQPGPAVLAAAAYINSIVTQLQPLNLIMGVLSRPSDEVVTTQTTTHADGSTSVRTLSHVTRKTGEITPVILAESRNNRWEYQRRRDNGRGLTGGQTPLVQYRFGE